MRSIARWRSAGLVCLIGLAGSMGAPVSVAETTNALPPAPTSLVTDETGFLTSATRGALEAGLERHERSTGQQVVLWIGRRDSREVLEDWAARAFAAWGIGRHGHDDGVAIFVFPEQRQIRIEVGYGLEGALPDVRAAQIIRDEMTPRLSRGDRDGAARAGVAQVLAALGDRQSLVDAEPLAEPSPAGPVSWLKILFYSLLGLILLIFLVNNPRLALALLINLASSGGGRDRRRGGGGFRGGGGRSGGGGASGSW